MQNPPPNQQYPPPQNQQQQGYGTPPNQQGYGYNNPYGAPPNAQMQGMAGANTGAKSALGVDANVAGALAYIGIIGLILIIIEKDNRFVRFHAMQSLLTAAANFVLMITIGIVWAIMSIILVNISPSLTAIVGILVWLLYVGLFLAVFGGLIYAAVKAYQGKIFKLPVVGNFAEKFVNK